MLQLAGSNNIETKPRSGILTPQQFIQEQTDKIVADLKNESPNGYHFSCVKCLCYDMSNNSFSVPCKELECKLLDDDIRLLCTDGSCAGDMNMEIDAIGYGMRALMLILQNQ